MNVVVTSADIHRISGDQHALNHDMRVELQDFAVLAGAGLAFVRIAHQELRPGKLARHETPLQASRKTGAAASTQTGFLDRRDDLVGGQTLATILAKNLAQRLVAAACLIVLQTPVTASQASQNLRVDVTPVETGLCTVGLKLGQDIFKRHYLFPWARRPSTS